MKLDRAKIRNATVTFRLPRLLVERLKLLAIGQTVKRQTLVTWNDVVRETLIDRYGLTETTLRTAMDETLKEMKITNKGEQ